MIRVGITGQSGFIGTHLSNSLNLFSDKFERVPFEDEFFMNRDDLFSFVKSCDVIVHLAAVNRHSDLETMYQINIGLIKLLIDACEATSSLPHIVFSSSTQELSDNLYGQSKKEGRALFEEWANRNDASFTGLIIPNVYGPFGKPNYNSVVATFCYQLTHEMIPRIEFDGSLQLIYVGELINYVLNKIEDVNKDLAIKTKIDCLKVPFTSQIAVSELLSLIKRYQIMYMGSGEIPALETEFNRNLFNTFLCYIDHSTFYPFKLYSNKDLRGSFFEILKHNSGGQVSLSTTFSGITRGNHFHTRKSERFAVVKGRARIDVRRVGTDQVLSFELDGRDPGFVDIPIWFTHNITNIGEDDLYTIFWITEHFDASDPDTYFERV